VSAEDLDDLLAIEAAGDADRARNGDADAGERLLDSLLSAALEARGKGLRFDPVEPADLFSLLGLDRTGQPGRIPKAVRAEAARRLRAIVDLAREGAAPEPLLAFYSTAAGEIEAGAEPRRTLGLKRGRGRPRREGELTRVIVDAITDEAKRRAIAEGESHLDATGIAGERGAELGRRGSSESTAQRAIKRAREKLPNS